MPTQEVETVYFNDGTVKKSDYIYIAAKLQSVDADKHDFSRLFIYYRGDWTHHDLQSRVESVCYYSELEAFCALSANGEVNIATRQGFQVEKIPQAGVYDGLAAVNQMRQIGQHLYVCGDQGQVYRRDESCWVQFDDGLRDSDISASALCLNSIDGTSDENIW